MAAIRSIRLYRNVMNMNHNWSTMIRPRRRYRFCSNSTDTNSTPALSTNIPSNVKGPSHWKLSSSHKPYKTTEVFNANTIPPIFTSKHNTKSRVTGCVHVIEGELKVIIYANNDDIEEDMEYTVKKGECVIIAPKQWHRVSGNTDDIKFYIEFWKKKRS